MLQQMEAVDWRLVIRAVEVIAKSIRRMKQLHAEPFTAAVRLEDKRAAVKTPPCGLDEQLLAGDEDGIRRADAGRFEGGVLAGLADLEIEGAAAVDDAAPVALEPGQHRGGQLGRIPVIAGVRRGAHPVVEDAIGRRSRQVEDTAVKKPVAPRKRRAIERSG